MVQFPTLGRATAATLFFTILACSDDLASPGDPTLPYSAVATVVPDTVEGGAIVQALAVTVTVTNQSGTSVDIPPYLCGNMTTALFEPLTTTVPSPFPSPSATWTSPFEVCTLALSTPYTLQIGESYHYTRKYTRSIISAPAGSYDVTITVPAPTTPRRLSAGRVVLP